MLKIRIFTLYLRHATFIYIFYLYLPQDICCKKNETKIKESLETCNLVNTIFFNRNLGNTPFYQFYALLLCEFTVTPDIAKILPKNYFQSTKRTITGRKKIYIIHVYLISIFYRNIHRNYNKASINNFKNDNYTVKNKPHIW